MKYKKYLLILLLIVLFGCNKVYADDSKIISSDSKECFYLDNVNNAKNGTKFKMRWNVKYYGFVPGSIWPEWGANLFDGSTFTSVRIDVVNGELAGGGDYVINWYSDFKDKNATGLTVSKIYNGKREANQGGKDCPNYLVVRTKDNKITKDGIYAFNNANEANMFSNASNQLGNYGAWVLSNRDSSGNQITSDTYYNALQKTLDLTVPGIDIKDINCDTLFGDKNDPESLANLIDTLLQYVRIIVPILIIGLGSVDLAKAAISSKEDEMKKAQQKFVKRIIAGVAVFLSPIIVDVIMKIADITWEGLGYTTCNF